MCVTDSELKKEEEKEDPTRRAHRGGTAEESWPRRDLRKKNPREPRRGSFWSSQSLSTIAYLQVFLLNGHVNGHDM